MRTIKRLLVFFGLALATSMANSTETSYDTSPGRPEDFGYKVSWFAVKSTNSTDVASALGFTDGAPANWAAGLAAAYASSGNSVGRKLIFISPPVNGWVFVVGSALPYPVTLTSNRDDVVIGQKFRTLFDRLSGQFEDVQFFGSYRVVDFVSWARATQGKLLRAFSFADGTVYANVGMQTKEEEQLHFPNLSSLSTDAATERLFEADGRLPDEDDVIKLAGLWSVNTEQLSANPVSTQTGLVVQLPEDLAQ